MVSLRLPATAGVVACVAVAVSVLVPYAVVEPGGMETYYGYGLAGAWSTFGMALIGVVVFAAGREGRTAPDLAAGAGFGIGVVATLFGAIWAAAVPYDVVTQLSTELWFLYHRAAVVVGALLIAICGLWYAYELDLF